jgi:hypothetical protein
MDTSIDVQVRELCRRVVTERDAEKMLALLHEVNRLVAEKVAVQANSAPQP